MSARKGDWDEKEGQVIGMLARLRRADAPRNPALAQDARQRFLEEAARLRPEAAQAVSPTRKSRHIEWIHLNFLKKENVRMSTLVTILVVVSLALGGTGATVFAAQSSLPGDALYGVKVAGEAVEAGFTVREQSRLQLALRLSDARIDEMAGLAKAGKDISEDLVERWQFQVERTLGLCEGMTDMELEGALVQVREHLRSQDGVMAGLKTQERLRDRVREMIHDRLVEVEAGLGDPQEFRNRHQNDQQGEGGQNPWTTGTPTPGSSDGPGYCVNCTPEGGKNPWTTGTPTPGSGYGPGPGDCDTCTPEGEHHPWMTGTPTPGSGYGPGPGPNPEHTGMPPSGGGTGDGGHHDDPGGSSGGGSGGEGGHDGGMGGGGHH